MTGIMLRPLRTYYAILLQRTIGTACGLSRLAIGMSMESEAGPMPA